MIRDLLLESRLGVIPSHLDLLYHFTRNVVDIIKDDTIVHGEINYGLESVQEKIPSIQGVKGAVSLTRNRRLLWRNVPFGFLFERKELQRFYKLYQVQPTDEWIGNLKTSGKRNNHHEWDEEVIAKPIRDIKSIAYGLIIREHLAIQTKILKDVIELFEMSAVTDYDIYIQNQQGFLSEKISDNESFAKFINGLIN